MENLYGKINCRKFIISKEDYKKYFNGKKMISIKELEKYYKGIVNRLSTKNKISVNIIKYNKI